MKNRGFTLVELLAVIVVLAIIMIIAVPAVLDSMEAAKFNSFKIFGQNAIRKAMELHQEEELTGERRWVTGHYYSGSDSADYDRINCYPLDVLKLETGGKYKGSVWYNDKDKTYRLYLTDGTYYTYFFPYKSNTKESASSPTRVGITLNDLNNATLEDATYYGWIDADDNTADIVITPREEDAIVELYKNTELLESSIGELSYSDIDVLGNSATYIIKVINPNITPVNNNPIT